MPSGTSDKGKAVLEQMIQAVEKGGTRTPSSRGPCPIFALPPREAALRPLSRWQGSFVLADQRSRFGSSARAAVDGDDNVWISSFGPATAGIVEVMRRQSEGLAARQEDGRCDFATRWLCGRRYADAH